MHARVGVADGYWFGGGPHLATFPLERQPGMAHDKAIPQRLRDAVCPATPRRPTRLICDFSLCCGFVVTAQVEGASQTCWLIFTASRDDGELDVVARRRPSTHEASDMVRTRHANHWVYVATVS
jgi:hypothetical protein